MKTIQDLQKELNALLADADQCGSVGLPKKLAAKIRATRHLIQYLKTNPAEEVVRAQLVEVRRKLNFMPNRYDRWFDDLSKDEKKDPALKIEGEIQQGARGAEAARSVADA